MGGVPAPRLVIHHVDPGLPCAAPNVVFVLGGPWADNRNFLIDGFSRSLSNLEAWYEVFSRADGSAAER